MEKENEGIPVKRIVTSSLFNQVIMVLIVANAALLGIEIDVSSGLSQKACHFSRSQRPRRHPRDA